MQWKMVKVVVLAVMLSACATSNTLKPVLGDESYTPYGWQKWCLEHKEDKDCYLN